jgi:ABC-type branched-subunit amino acid transport system ATPase component
MLVTPAHNHGVIIGEPNKLTAFGITMMFGGVKALDNVDFSVPKGCSVGLLGQNGSGKTTLINILTGQLQPQSGGLIVNGQPMLGHSPRSFAQAGMARVFQSVQVFPRLSVLENLQVAQLGAHAATSDINAAAVARRLGLHRWLSKSARDISYGHQRVLEIAMALVAGADLLLLDEPTAGLDPSLVNHVIACLEELRDGGTSVVIIEHETEVVFRLCSEVYVLNEGRVLAHGSPAAIRSNPLVLELYLGAPGK